MIINHNLLYMAPTMYCGTNRLECYSNEHDRMAPTIHCNGTCTNSKRVANACSTNYMQRQRPHIAMPATQAEWHQPPTGSTNCLGIHPTPSPGTNQARHTRKCDITNEKQQDNRSCGEHKSAVYLQERPANTCKRLSKVHKRGTHLGNKAQE